ncbi:winged helix-turn-helix domain-containing protein [Planomonospora parontospora]|uniref:winged helix-turn-helix domain-containing protein n=1 Tax=Planomonospora parontospora TaxID=58119 RepID=UPI0016712307|nr:crosslink repair DNA glycosylase YcaQ family protein [Planomonospora parontospora]GGL58990.1 hypothetical protein GCM10014719_70530 [Planomonospora parontospora subsp. antibiotica]GII20282.1 hypothetical protein Ppa05_70080 [Planomonospora parontospora subsp. antibiotica]
MSNNSVLSLSCAEARRLAVAAQGLTEQSDLLTPLNILRHLGAIQLDAIQRVDKAHRLVCLARASALKGRQTLDDGLWSSSGPAAVFESWAHAVCLLPIEDWPLWEFSRQRTEKARWAPPATVCDRLINLVRDQGPMTIRQLEAGAVKSSGWNWSETKTAAEFLVWTGGLICAERKGSQRIYDLPERRIPSHLLNKQLSETQSLATLVSRAAQAYGVATVSDLTEYFRLTRKDVESVVAEIGLIRANVEGWTDPAWVHPSMINIPSSVTQPVFLTPFDNLIWDRERTRRLFGFSYTFEAYKPAAKRQYGYYVTPLLVEGSIIGRADLTREGNDLVALAAYYESQDMRNEQALMQAGWRLAMQLGCDEFRVVRESFGT